MMEKWVHGGETPEERAFYERMEAVADTVYGSGTPNMTLTHFVIAGYEQAMREHGIEPAELPTEPGAAGSGGAGV